MFLGCCLHKSSAACKCLYQGLILAYTQTVWALIRLLLEEQSDLGPHCLLQRHFKSSHGNCNLRPLICTMYHPRFVELNHMEECISIQRGHSQSDKSAINKSQATVLYLIRAHVPSSAYYRLCGWLPLFLIPIFRQ